MKLNTQKMLPTIIVIIVVGILIYAYIGARHRSVNIAPNANESANLIITEKGSEVDPILKEKVLAAYSTQKALYASADLPKIRAYLTEATEGNEDANITKMNDAELKDFSIFMSNTMNRIGVEELRAPDVLWEFNADKTEVTLRTIHTDDKGKMTFSIMHIYKGGKWY